MAANEKSLFRPFSEVEWSYIEAFLIWTGRSLAPKRENYTYYAGSSEQRRDGYGKPYLCFASQVEVCPMQEVFDLYGSTVMRLFVKE